MMTVAMRHDTAPDPVSTRRSGRGTKYLQGSTCVTGLPGHFPAHLSGVGQPRLYWTFAYTEPRLTVQGVEVLTLRSCWGHEARLRWPFASFRRWTLL